MPDTPNQPQDNQPEDQQFGDHQPVGEHQPVGDPRHEDYRLEEQRQPDQRQPDQRQPDPLPQEQLPHDSPPPAPWWSQPSEPDPTNRSAEQPAGGQPANAQATNVFGSPVGRDEQAQIWGQPSNTGAPAWGYPSDPYATPSQPANSPAGATKRGRKAAFAGVILATALVAGGVGGAIGAENSGSGSLLDSSASLGSGGSASQAVDRAPTSVAGIAAKLLVSVVSISVKAGSSGGTGSGVVIRSDGYIVTNNHVVEAAATGGIITVSFNDADQTDLPAQIVGRDPETDLAVIKVDGRTLTPATLGQSRSLVVGDPVIAIGSPLGLAGTVTSGIISALNRTVNVPGENGARTPLFNAVQTDAAINPGNSGGALVDSGGRVIGINSAIATLGGGASPFGGEAQSGSIGVGFAIPVDEARSVAEELIRTGKATHPAIGVEASTMGESSGSGQRGARISRLVTGGSAEKAGLQAGDLITMIEGTTVHSVDELILAIREHKVGDAVTVTYVRAGKTATAKLVLQDKTPR